MPEILSDFYNSGFYALESRAMRVVSISAGSRLAFSAVSHFSVVADVESSFEAVVEVPIDYNVAKKEVAFCFFVLQTYRHKVVGLAFFSSRRS